MQVLSSPTTFGAEGLNFCVRDGNRCDSLAKATRTILNFQSRLAFIQVYQIPVKDFLIFALNLLCSAREGEQGELRVTALPAGQAQAPS